MKGRLRAAGSLSKTVPSCTTTIAINPIWITDDLLADTYRTFARQPLHKRYGSNVPGPLEARRRASKRRNTSWAHVPSARPPVEPAILFGKHSPTGWWQDGRRQPEPPRAASEHSLLPSWLLPRAPPLEPSPKPSLLPSWLHPTTVPIPKQVTSPLELFPSLETLSELSPSSERPTIELSASANWKRCKNVQDIHAMVLEEGINLQHNPYITATIFREASISQWPVHEITQFLTDPTLNPPHVRHCSRLLSRVREFQRWKRAPPSEKKQRAPRSDLPDHLLFPKNWIILQAAFCRAASLGLIDSQGVQQMIDLILALESKELALETIHHNIYELVTSFHLSRVCCIRDLDHSWTAKLVSKLLSRRPSTPTIKLLLLFRNEQHLEDMIVSSLKTVIIPSPSHILSNTRVQSGLGLRDQPPTAEPEMPNLIPERLPARALVEADDVLLSSEADQLDLDQSSLNLMNDRWYDNMRRTRPDTLAELASGITTNLPKFIYLARRLVYGDKLAIRVVKRVLEHNVSLKNSLAQSWPQRVDYLESVDRLSHQPGDTNPTNPKDEGHIFNPPEALRLIERLALSFALTPSLTNRTALLQVRWCYLFLLRHGAPITPVISHALWQAGVVRYRGHGPGPTQLKWILKIVVQVEGKGVARMLLRNSQFRKDRETWLKLVDADDDRQPEDAAEGSVSRLVYHSPPRAPFLDLSLKAGKETT